MRGKVSRSKLAAPSSVLRPEYGEVTSPLNALVLRFRRGESVRLKRPMRHKLPNRVGGRWATGLSATNPMIGRPPATGPVSGYVVVLSFQRAAHIRTHWAHPCLLRNHLLTFASHLDGRRTGERDQSVLPNNERLTIAEKSYDSQWRGRNLILNSLSSVVRNRGSFAKPGNLRHGDYWDYFPLFDGMQPRKLMSDMRGMRGKSREAQVSERDPTSVVMDVTRCFLCSQVYICSLAWV